MSKLVGAQEHKEIAALCKGAVCGTRRLNSQQLARLRFLLAAFIASQEGMRDTDDVTRLTIFPGKRVEHKVDEL